MEQRDLLKEQIEQLGRVLGKILADFLKIKTDGNAAQAIEITTQEIKSELDIDWEYFSGLKLTEIVTHLHQKKISSVHYEPLAKLLEEIGVVTMNTEPKKARLHFEKALFLLEKLDELTNSISFDRISQKQRLKERITGQ